MKDNSGVSLLANRYASAAMLEIFAPEAKIIAERKLWIAVMRAQSTLGHAISKDVITDYEKVITQVDLASIDAREKKTRHDVKARIEEFNALAGHEAIHAGTAMNGNGLVSAGGRVMTVTGIGSDLTEARNRAYRAISQIELEGSFYRSDIALNASVAEKGN